MKTNKKDKQKDPSFKFFCEVLLPEAAIFTVLISLSFALLVMLFHTMG